MRRSKSPDTRSPTPFPQMTYDQAIRLYGIDKPDLRLPAMTDVSEAFTAEAEADSATRRRLAHGRRSHSRIGELSRKERDENKLSLFARPRAPKLIDDLKRLEKSFPETVAKIRQRTAKPLPTTCWSSLPERPCRRPF